MAEGQPELVDYDGLARRIYRDLAAARGAVRARRTAPFGPDPALAQLAEQARGVLRQAAVDTVAWADLGEPPPAADRHPVLYRIGSVRAGTSEVPIALPLLGIGHVTINGEDESYGPAGELFEPEVSAVVGNLVLRVLGSTAPGTVTLAGDHWLPGYLHSADLHAPPLAKPVDPARPSEFDNLLNQLRRRPATPWTVLVLSRVHQLLSEHQYDELAGILRSGPARGVHAILIDTQLPSDVPAEQVWLGHRRVRTSISGPLLDVRLDALPMPDSPAMEIVGRLREHAQQADAAAVTPQALLPARLWDESSATELRAPVGFVDGAPAELRLGDAPTHALIGGPTGSGKTNLIYGWIAGLATRYGPDELELFLLDFKEGVSIKRFAPSARDPNWLPQARLVGVNINEDREFGLALLRYLSRELRRRASAAKEHDATSLSELRAADPSGRWPRLVAVIDEFQYLVQARDKITEEAVALLEDLARRGRSQGIHLVLCSQDLSSIDALWGRPSLVAQLTLRIALPKAQRVLAGDNPRADTVPKHHAVINPDSGAKSADQVVRLPYFDAGFLDELLRRLCTQATGAAPPVLFDGNLIPELSDAAAFTALRPLEQGQGSPVALTGRLIDVEDRAAGMRVQRAPGRNLAVLGNRLDEACDVLATAFLSLGRQHQPGTARFTLAACDEDTIGPAQRIAEQLKHDGHLVRYADVDDLDGLLAETAADVDAALAARRSGQPHYLALFAVDAASTFLRADHLIKVMQSGSEVRTHVFGWWRTAQRMKDQLGGFATKLDEIGAWVALDVRGEELGSLPGGQLLSWYPRKRRALFFDRDVHRTPEVLIPYRTGLGAGER
jgi:FtsK/SpoIIIE family